MSTPDITTSPFDPPLEVGEGALYDAKLTKLQALIPGFRLLPGQLLEHVLRASAVLDAETREAFVALVSDRISDVLGAIHQIPRLTGSPATSSITIEALNTAGHELADGARLYLAGIPLETVGTLTIPADETTGTVQVQTVEATAAHNGAASEDPADLELDEPQDWIAENGVTLDGPLVDGTDPETSPAYGVRLAELLQVLSPKPIFERDFAVLARQHPAVGVAWAINLYDPIEDEHDVPRAVTVVVADELGEPLSAPTKAEVAALYANPLLNLDVHVVDPTYVDVDITGTTVALPGFDDDETAAAAAARLTEITSPAPWVRQTQFGNEPNTPPTRTVHVHELIAQADGVLGVDYVPTMQIGDGSSDHLELTTPIMLPRPGTITITAEVP